MYLLNMVWRSAALGLGAHKCNISSVSMQAHADMQASAWSDKAQPKGQMYFR